MRVVRLTAAVPRERTAVGVCSNPLRRISSEIPGTMRSAMACVASGVLSRGPMPVPPVVSKTSRRPESASSRNCWRIPAESSEIADSRATSHPSPRQAATTAGPERSSRSPLATLSLIVRTATRIRRDSSAELLRRDRVLVAIGFVHEPHRFHQQACGVFCGSRALGSVGRIKVNLEIARGPQDDFINSVVAFHLAYFGVAALAARKIKFALDAIIAHAQPAGFLPHFERLHQVDHAHLFQPPLDDSGAGGAL